MNPITWSKVSLLVICQEKKISEENRKEVIKESALKRPPKNDFKNRILLKKELHLWRSKAVLCVALHRAVLRIS